VHQVLSVLNIDQPADKWSEASDAEHKPAALTLQPPLAGVEMPESLAWTSTSSQRGAGGAGPADRRVVRYIPGDGTAQDPEPSIPVAIGPGSRR
jgi:hypothetical protein